MDKIGTGFRTVGDKLIVKLSVVPDTNINVYDENGAEIGKLVDIIGPVRAPFGVVITNRGQELQGKTIMLKTSNPDNHAK